MIAYKFLDEGRIGPFTAFQWPVGEWVDAGGVDPCLEGVHACRPRDLPIWLGRELWEIELDGSLVEQERKVVASSRPRIARCRSCGSAARPGMPEWHESSAAFARVGRGSASAT